MGWEKQINANVSFLPSSTLIDHQTYDEKILIQWTMDSLNADTKASSGKTFDNIPTWAQRGKASFDPMLVGTVHACHAHELWKVQPFTAAFLTVPLHIELLPRFLECSGRVFLVTIIVEGCSYARIISIKLTDDATLRFTDRCLKVWRFLNTHKTEFNIWHCTCAHNHELDLLVWGHFYSVMAN